MSLTTTATAIANLMIDAIQGKASVLELLLLLTLFIVFVIILSTAFGMLVTMLNSMAAKVGRKQAAQQRIARRWSK